MPTDYLFGNNCCILYSWKDDKMTVFATNTLTAIGIGNSYNFTGSTYQADLVYADQIMVTSI